MTMSRILSIGMPGMDHLTEQAESAALHALCSIRTPEGLTDAQEHRFWSVVITCVERRCVLARKDLGPAPPADLVAVRDDAD